MSKRYDFSTAEGRDKIFKKLCAKEVKNDRTIKVARIKNILVALAFAFNIILFMGYLCDVLMKAFKVTSELLTRIPVVSEFLPFADGFTDGVWWTILLFAVIFLIVAPGVFGLVIRIILSFIIKKKKVSCDGLSEEDGINAILEKSDAVNKKAKSYTPPFGVMYFFAIISAVAGAVCSVMMINESGLEMSVLGWIIFGGSALLALFASLLFALLASTAFSLPSRSRVRLEYEKEQAEIEAERRERERREREERAKEEARREQERLDAMTGEELYNYALEIEDNNEQLKYLRMAEKRGYKDACYMITVVERMIEEEKYKKSKALMDAGWAAQDRGDYRLAKSKFLDAAYLDNPDGMYNYARLCLRDGERQSAIRWLEKAIASGTYDDEQSRQLLSAIKRGEHINVTD